MRRYPLFLLIMLFFVLRIPTVSAFYDTETHWAKDAITFTLEKGLMEGTSSFTYSPDVPASRAEIVSALYHVAGSPANNNVVPHTFQDVASTAPYAAAVQWAVTNQIITGTTAATFSPDNMVTREQLAVIFHRFASAHGDVLPRDTTQTIARFADLSAFHPYAKEAAEWALQTALLTGMPNNRFVPEGSTTRAELAVILQRYITTAVLSLPAESTDSAPQPQIHSYTAFTAESNPVTRTDIIAAAADGSHITYSYADVDHCTVDMGRVVAKKALPAHPAALYRLFGTEGTIRWYDPTLDVWYEEPLTAGTRPKGMYFIRVDNQDTILVTPQTYRLQDNGMIEYLPEQDGRLLITQNDESFALTLEVATLPANTFSDFLVLTSQQILVNWADADSLARWSNYRFTDANRWCLNGYYYRSPSSYFPYGENYFHNLPAAYIACKMTRNRGDVASRALGLAMMDIMKKQQNEQGFIPSKAGSTWLLDDYKIGPGYYDTRFNTDFFLACLDAAESFGTQDWIPNAVRYGDFLVSFAREHHYSFGSDEGDQKEGWLVQDYWYPDCLPTHTSLNHHAAETIFLYRLAEAVQKDSYAEVADRMVRGIEATQEKWVLPNGDFYYSYAEDGTMTGTDYPSLTYNDLVELQRIYTLRYKTENPAIASLIVSKRRWMDANHVTP